MMPAPYPVQFSVAYPDRPLSRLTTLLRLVTVIPIAIVLWSIDSGDLYLAGGTDVSKLAIGGGGILFLGPLLMILFRRKYPRWWFDWNLELQRFVNRVGVYMLLMDDRYPSTDDHQGVRLDIAYPDAARELNRWLPLIKWFLAIPQFIVLWVLSIGVLFATIFAWFAILVTGRYPHGVFRFVEGVLRWSNRVLAYSLLLVTDRYPPFRLEA